MNYPHETENSQVGVFFGQTKRFGDEVFLCAKFWDGEPVDEWVDISWNESAQIIRSLGAGLIEKGIKKNDRMAIFSNNRPRWVLSDLAIQGAAGIGVPTYPTSTDSQLEFILNDCGAVGIFAGDSELVEQALRVKKKTPKLKYIIALSLYKGGKASGVIGFDDLLALGSSSPKALEEFDKRRSEIKEEDIAAIIYTSGTTGNPKGVVLDQSNFKGQNIMTLGAPFTRKILEREIRFTTLCHLPLCHIMGRASDYHAQMALGSKITFAESIQKVPENLLEVRPQILASVPRLFEKIYELVQRYASRLTGFRKAVFNWAMKTGRKAAGYMIRGEKIPPFLSIKFSLANVLVYRYIRERAGLDRLVTAMSGGGALSAEIVTFFRSMNVIIAEGYGLTETTSPVSWNGPRFIKPLPETKLYNKAFEWLVDAIVVMQGKGINPFTNLVGLFKIIVASKTVLPYIVIKPGFVGRPLDGTDIKLADDGEILVKGPQVFKKENGYYNNKEATDEAFTKDGYFITGDIGIFDSDGFLAITDRKKELLVTSSGKNIAPMPIELSLVVDPLIDQVCVLGDARNFIAALIVPEFQSLERYAREKGIEFESTEELIKKPEIIDKYNELIAHYNEKLARFEQIRKFTLLARPFAVETDELTPTLKMKRRVISENYAKEIEAMYS